MQLIFRCPRCSATGRIDDVERLDRVTCAQCDFERPVSPDDLRDGQPARCLACGCEDLWRQKDFNPKFGLMMVGLGILFSTIAWARMEPVIAIGILMGFALIDMALFVLMRDVLVCYRCGARHRHSNPSEEHPKFNLELHERYRQEAIRLEQSKS